MDEYGVCCAPTADGTRLRVRVTPRAATTRVAGLHGDALKVRLAAPPVDGKANAALVAWLADVLGVRARDLTLTRGERSRDKVVDIHGVPPPVVARRLAAAP